MRGSSFNKTKNTWRWGLRGKGLHVLIQQASNYFETEFHRKGAVLQRVSFADISALLWKTMSAFPVICAFKQKVNNCGEIDFL